MPLSLGLRDEENERINNILNKLTELTFVPDGWLSNDIESLLAQLGLSLESLEKMTGNELNEHVTKMHFDWANMERLADMLAINPAFKEKALSLYSFIQTKSKMFSLEIFNKINRIEHAKV